MSKNKCIVTISREYGSGGRVIGKKLAKLLGIPFYDKELIKLISQKTGFREDLIAQAEQKRESSIYFAAYDVTLSMPMTHEIFKIESDLVKQLGEEGSCVIIGRCADYLLRDNKNSFNVFVYASLEERIRRAKEDYKIQVKDVKAHILKLDKDRAAYYNYYTEYKWGERKNYHLLINSNIGVETAVDIIKTAYESRMRGN